jgi:hypothetical protein
MDAVGGKLSLAASVNAAFQIHDAEEDPSGQCDTDADE